MNVYLSRGGWINKSSHEKHHGSSDESGSSPASVGRCGSGPQSGVSLATIHRAEAVEGKTAMTFANASAVRRAFEAAGVELIEEDGGGPGARLKLRVSD